MSWKPGDWKATCHACGREYLASTMRKSWKGHYVCAKDWEPRHPQDFVRATPERQVPPWTQPSNLTSFTSFCDPNGRTALPGLAIPGCALPSFIDPAHHLTTFP